MVEKINITDVQEDETNVDWYADGERANAEVLNRPIKQISGVVNQIIEDGIGGQFLGEGAVKGIQYLGQEATGVMVVPVGTNAMAIDSLTLSEGSELTVENGSVFKVI